MKAKKGDWVKIHSIVLQPEERAPQVPEDTKKVPLETWVKGFLLDDWILYLSLLFSRLLIFLAQTAIKKDEEIVNSVDRIR